ncbi:MAG: DUF493 family protein [Bacteroidota bacterium]
MQRLPSPDEEDAWWERFQGLLDDQNEWPAEYLFKFIAPLNGLDTLTDILQPGDLTVRPSRKGNYVSVTARREMTSSEAVVAVYKSVAVVDGLISL